MIPGESAAIESPHDTELRLLLELKRRRACRRSLLTWCTTALEPYDQVPARHHRLLIDELECVAGGTTDRLAIFMPPGAAKSRYASILFPPWFLAQKPGLDVIAASYNAELAEDFSGAAIGICQEHATTLGYSLRGREPSRKLWRTSNRGSYRAAGAGGGITGRRADLIVIDDPIRGREDADSETLRGRVWDWYRAEVVTRLKPGGRVVLIQTRWHEADLAGQLLNEMKSGGDHWRVLSLPAIAEDDNDPLGRRPGQALWPEYEDAAALERKRIAVGEREWASLYQQRPRPREGAMFKREKIVILDVAPAGGQVVRYWDFASTKKQPRNDPDWTVGLKLQQASAGLFVVVDVVRLRGSPDEVLEALVNTAAQDGRAVRIGLPQDPGEAGKTVVLYRTRALAGYSVESTRETGAKVTRWDPVASQANVGNLAVVRAPWNRVLLDELAGVPSAAHDDQADALAGAFAMLVGRLDPLARFRALAS
jgi:predicted phage terminase large subunit-like protein